MTPVGENGSSEDGGVSPDGDDAALLAVPANNIPNAPRLLFLIVGGMVELESTFFSFTCVGILSAFSDVGVGEESV